MRRALLALAAALLAASAAAADRPLAESTGIVAGIEAPVPTSTSPAWRQWKQQADESWAKLEATQLRAQRAWAASELGNSCPGGELYYPFSGPDALNAVTLFPTCDSYVLFGLEPAGSIPSAYRLSDAQLQKLTRSMVAATEDLWERNYFITSYMLTDIRAADGGVALLVATTLHRLGYQPVSIEYDITRPEPRSRALTRPVRSFKLVVADAGGKQKTLYYFSLDAADRSISASPNFREWLLARPRQAALVKSASYLLAAPEFKFIYSTLTDVKLLVQDDTGIRYDELVARGFKVTLYGKYLPPVADFNYGNQPKLASAYRAAPTRELPFPFSYHWQPGQGNLQIYRR